MNNLILCEGETDAILLSYYLQRTCGWRFVKKSPPGVNIKGTGFTENRPTGINGMEIIC